MSLSGLPQMDHLMLVVTPTNQKFIAFKKANLPWKDSAALQAIIPVKKVPKVEVLTPAEQCKRHKKMDGCMVMYAHTGILCICGHPYGEHTAGTKGPCSHYFSDGGCKAKCQHYIPEDKKHLYLKPGGTFEIESEEEDL